MDGIIIVIGGIIIVMDGIMDGTLIIDRGDQDENVH